MQISIRDVLGLNWPLDSYPTELAELGWIYHFDVKRSTNTLTPLRTAITENDLWSEFHFLPHASPDSFDRVTVRFKSVEDCLWAKMFFDETL